jgi:signal recognition particle GTPase
MDGKDVLIVDTAGRLHVDAALMDELVEIRKAVKPHNILLVVDAMTGQDAVNVAEQFAEAVDFDGVLMSKLDGDARGGAALSARRSPASRSCSRAWGRSSTSSSASTPSGWRSGSSAWAT